MTVTPEIEAEIMRAHGANPKRFSPFKVAHATGVNISDVLATVRKNSATMTDGTEHSGGQGRPDLADVIIASRRVMDAGWDNADPGVVEARARYCAGTHDMATHRDGAWLHLCSFPLTRPRRPRPGYFA